jgi:hypothetical protein
MLVKRIAPIFATGLNDRAPATSDTAFQQARKRILQRRLRQMVEKDLGHDRQSAQSYWRS